MFFWCRGSFALLRFFFFKSRWFANNGSVEFVKIFCDRSLAILSISHDAPQLHGWEVQSLRNESCAIFNDGIKASNDSLSCFLDAASPLAMFVIILQSFQERSDQCFLVLQQRLDQRLTVISCWPASVNQPRSPRLFHIPRSFFLSVFYTCGANVFHLTRLPWSGTIFLQNKNDIDWLEQNLIGAPM